MPVVIAIHNVKHEVYHNNSECPDRNKIKMTEMRFGTGGKPLCPVCEKLTLEGK